MYGRTRPGSFLDCVLIAILQKLTGKCRGLQACVEVVLSGETFKDGVEAVECIDPVVDVTSWERPSFRETLEMLWEQM